MVRRARGHGVAGASCPGPRELFTDQERQTGVRVTGILAVLVSSWLLGACGSDTPTASTGALETVAASADSIESDDRPDEGEENSIRSALADARRLWSEAAIDTYRLEVAEELNYWSRGCAWITVVTDGVATEVSVDPASTGPECSEVEWTVEQLHDLILRNANELDQFSDPSFGEHILDVEFNDVGVPVSINFDLANGADEETSLRLTFTH